MEDDICSSLIDIPLSMHCYHAQQTNYLSIPSIFHIFKPSGGRQTTNAKHVQCRVSPHNHPTFANEEKNALSISRPSF